MPLKNYIINIADIAIEAGLITLIIFMPLAYGCVEVWSQTAFELLTLSIFIIWILKNCISGRLTIYRSPLDIPIIIFFILAIASRFYSIYPHISKMSISRLMAYLILYYVIINNFTSFSKLKRLSLYIVSSAIIISIIGIIGYFNKKTISSLWPYAMFSTFTSTSHFVGYVGTIFPITLILFLEVNIIKKIYFIFSAVIITTAVLFCQDKGGWIQFISAIIFLMLLAKYSGILKRKGVILLLIFTLFIWAVSFYGFQPIIQRLAPLFTLHFKTSPEVTIWERWVYWQDTLKIIKTYPIFGTGIGTFSVIYPQFRNPVQNYFLNYAHQDFLQLASEMGLLGLGVFTWLLFSIFRIGVRLIKNNIPRYYKSLIVGSLSGGFGLLIHSFYDFNLHIPANAAIFTIIVAVIPVSFLLINRESNKKTIFWCNLELSPVLRLFIFLIAAFFILCLAISIIKPYLAYLHYEQGKILEDNFEWDSAIEEYNKAKELDPRDSSYYYALGNIYTARASFDFLDKDYAQLAINNYNRAIRLNPYSGDYYLAAGNLYNILGYRELVLENLNKAISLDPKNESYRLVLEEFLKSE